MTTIEYLMVGALITAFYLMTFSDIQNTEAKIVAAVQDNGCASYQPPAPKHKTNIEAYNLDSLKGE